MWVLASSFSIPWLQVNIQKWTVQYQFQCSPLFSAQKVKELFEPVEHLVNCSYVYFFLNSSLMLSFPKTSISWKRPTSNMYYSLLYTTPLALDTRIKWNGVEFKAKEKLPKFTSGYRRCAYMKCHVAKSVVFSNIAMKFTTYSFIIHILKGCQGLS